MFLQLVPITTLSFGQYIAAPVMINILCETNNVMTFEDGRGEVFKALTLGRESEDQEVLLPKIVVMRVRTCHCRECPLFAIAPVVEMVASRSPSGAEPLGVAPLRDVRVSILHYPNTLRPHAEALLEDWEHKTDMPQIRYEYRP